MLIRCVLSAVFVALMAPGMSVGAQSAAPAADTGKIVVRSERRLTAATLGFTVQERVKNEPGIQVGLPPVVPIQIPEQPNAFEPRIVVETPTITCPILIVPVDPSIDPKLVAPTPKGTKFTMRSVAPPVCR